MGKRGPRLATPPCPDCGQKPVRWGDPGCYRCGCKQYQAIDGELRPVVRRAYKRQGVTPEEYEALNGWEPVEAKTPLAGAEVGGDG